MGPVVSAESKHRVEQAIDAAVGDGAHAALDGRGAVPQGQASSGGYFVGPTVLTEVDPDSPVNRDEVFGPLVTVHRVNTLEDAIQMANDTEFGNAATIYTKSGSAARAFEQNSTAGNIGVNAFPAPPMNFTMGGTGTSFYGDIHICGDGPVHFYTDHKLVVSRW
jgi:malonate-semialdehyde dehydrogenase (acetylating)/methylmalonate-semialdehyde dehydrogenase